MLLNYASLVYAAPDQTTQAVTSPADGSRARLLAAAQANRRMKDDELLLALLGAL